MLFTEVTGSQIRQDRELLDCSRYELAKRSGVSRLTVRLYEGHGAEPLQARTDVLGKLLKFLEGEGIEFRPNGGVFVQRAIPLSRRNIHPEATA